MIDKIKCPCRLRDYMDEDDCENTNCNECCPLCQERKDDNQ
jgi:hypothetical protein